MNFEEFHTFCLAKKGVQEFFPFDFKTIVYKVGGKIFALANSEDFTSINLKCEPEKALELRETFASVNPGYHMNKKHWNTVHLNSDVTDLLLYELINDSYQLVFESLSKKLQHEIALG